MMAGNYDYRTGNNGSGIRMEKKKPIWATGTQTLIPVKQTGYYHSFCRPYWSSSGN